MTDNTQSQGCDYGRSFQVQRDAITEREFAAGVSALLQNARALTAIEANIASETFFTAHEGRHGHSLLNHGFDYEEPVDSPLRLLTFCVLVLRNGLIVTGEAQADSPENFDAGQGFNIARQNAIAKIWPLMGCALKERLAG